MRNNGRWVKLHPMLVYGEQSMVVTKPRCNPVHTVSAHSESICFIGLSDHWLSSATCSS